jgi:hypothetical protein
MPEAGMGPDVIVVSTPLFDADLRFNAVATPGVPYAGRHIRRAGTQRANAFWSSASVDEAIVSE